MGVLNSVLWRCRWWCDNTGCSLKCDTGVSAYPSEITLMPHISKSKFLKTYNIDMILFYLYSVEKLGKQGVSYKWEACLMIIELSDNVLSFDDSWDF